MALNPGVWGIDIGQCALKAIRLEMVDGAVIATAFDYVEHPKILSQPDADPDQLIKDALEQFLSRNTIKGDKVAISVPGQSGLARFVKLPPVEEKKIADIVKFEAKQQIPFPLEEVVWDFQKIGQGSVTDGFAIDTEIGLFAMKRDMINRFLGHFNNVKVEVHYVQMSPLALCNYVTYDLLKKGGPGGEEDKPVIGKKQCAVALDIGTDSSNLIITDGARIIWQRPIPLGGNHFTRALTKELKLTFAKAEHLKRNAAKSPELPNILKALKPVLGDFVGEVQRSLGYFTNTHRDAAVTYMVGLGSAFRLPGLQKYLAEKLQLEVRKPTKFERLAGEEILSNPVFQESALTFPVAFGLALQGIGVSRLSTNLLPPEISLDRKIRAKKPWAVAAASIMLVGTGLLAFLSSFPYSAVNAEVLVKQMEGKDKSALDQAKKVLGEITKREGEVQSTKNEVQALIAGQDERINWIKLNDFINSALPVPGPKEQGGTLDDDLRRPLWSTNAGLEAAKKYRDRLSRGLDPKIGWDDDTRSALAVVDLEEITCRYTTNLKGFFDKAKADSKTHTGDELYGMTPADLAKPPEENEAGWVVELRGTTSYSQKVLYNTGEKNVQGREFIMQTLVKNLQDEAKKLATPQTTPEGEEKKSTGPGDPVRGKVSHVFLWGPIEDKNPTLEQFLWLQNTTPLSEFLVPPPTAASGEATQESYTQSGNEGGSMGGGAFGGGGASTSTTWKPLTGSGSSAAGGGGMGSMMGEKGGGFTPPSNFGGGGTSGSNPYSFKGAASSTTPGVYGSTMVTPSITDSKISGSTTSALPIRKSKPRYEFIVLFIWKEPTPSEQFRSKDSTTTTTTPSTTPSSSTSPPPGLRDRDR